MELSCSRHSVVILRQFLWILLCWTLGSLALESGSWTFFTPHQSYIDFSTDFQVGQKLSFGFSFKTIQQNGILFSHSLEKKEFPTDYGLKQYSFYSELRNGYLHVIYHFNNDYKDEITFNRALNNDEWHSVQIVLDDGTGKFMVDLDGSSQEIKLKAFTFGSAGRILNWTAEPSILTFGKKDDDGGEVFYNNFIGCMRDVRYGLRSGRLIDIPIKQKHSVKDGCINMCEEKNDCQNNGRCINKYYETECDCLGTHHEGQKCEESGATVVTFRGYEWLIYKLFEHDGDRYYSDKTRISLEFRTERKAGVLLYAVGDTPYHNHVTASVKDGLLLVSMSFGGEDLEVTMGVGLSNYRWHNLTINHEGNSVDVYLDGRVKHLTANGPRNFLSLEPNVYFGGGENFVVTRGLQVTQNFVGCLRNVFFNEHSLLYALKMYENKSNVFYHGGPKAMFKCQIVDNIPLSFPKPATMLLLDAGEKNRLHVEFEFKTVRRKAVLFYAELVSVGSYGGSEYGFIEVWVENGQLLLYFVPTSRSAVFSDNVTIPAAIVNDNTWHSLQLIFNNSQVKLKVDDYSVTTQAYHRILQHRGRIVIGYGLRKYKATEGFVGCVRGISLQDVSIDPLDIMKTRAVIGLKIDGCNLIDYCKDTEMCQHGSECLSDWDGIFCDCSTTAYEGKACYFPKYKESCDAYYQSGRKESGVYILDMDGAGELDPVHVQCNMGYQYHGFKYGKTIVENNLEPNSTIRDPRYSSLRKVLEYRGMNHEQLVQLTTLSAWCEQYIKYSCYAAPINLGKMTFFKAANGETVDYIGEGEPGTCGCSKNKTCAHDKCHCDLGDEVWRKDAGYNRVNHQLPVTEVVVKKNSGGKAQLSVDSLRCWGDHHLKPEKSVTFTREEPFLTLGPWKRGSFQISFRSFQTEAVIVYQRGTEQNKNYMIIKLVSADSILFDIVLNSGRVRKTLHTPYILNDGEWHLCTIHHDQYDVKLTLDMIEVMVDVPEGVSNVADFDGPLYVGGLPDNVAKEKNIRQPGLVGCMRGMVYNNVFTDLSHIIDSSLQGMSAGCMSSCWPNPCQNGGSCVEKWGSYECTCVNKWSQFGDNCQIDINKDNVTFTATNNSYLVLDSSVYRDALDETIVMSFRTFSEDGLLLYIYDEKNNFLQLSFKRGNKVIIKYSSFNEIFSKSVRVKNLNNGEWKQIVVEKIRDEALDTEGTKITVDDKFEIIPIQRLMLIKYSPHPFKGKEDVFPLRSVEPPAPFVHIWVGGSPLGLTAIPKWYGCVRGLKIGSKVYHLQQAAKQTIDVYPACNAGCDKAVCHNGGECKEFYKDKQYECNCLDSDFAGDHCNVEPSGLFNGNTIVSYNFTLTNREFRLTRTETISFRFKTDKSALKRKKMVLVYILSTKSSSKVPGRNDYIMLYMDLVGSIVVETDLGHGIARMKTRQTYADGKSHKVIYERYTAEHVLMVKDELDPLNNKNSVVDVEEPIVTREPDYTLDDVNTMYLGGFIKPTVSFSFLEFGNFNGCLSNVTFQPSREHNFKFTPLKDIWNTKRPETVVIGTFGDELKSCSTKKNTTGGQEKKKSILTPDFKILKMPEWNPGPAKTIFSGPPPEIQTTQATKKTTVKSRVTTPKNITAAVYVTRTGGSKMTIFIVVAVLAGLIVVGIILAVILSRYRSKRDKYNVLHLPDSDMELKQPLHQYSPAPKNHIATLDEFSVVSGGNKVPPVITRDPANRYSYTSVPLIDEDQNYNGPVIYNKKKQRPASSISEVIEELERRQKSNDMELRRYSGQNTQSSGEWETSSGREKPKSEFITLHHHPCMLTSHHPLEDLPELSYANSSLSSYIERPDEGDSMKNSSSNVVHNGSSEHNGDSGYEAESRPEITDGDTEFDITPMPSSPDQKMFNNSLSLSDMDPSSPKLMSTPKQPLLPADG